MEILYGKGKVVEILYHEHFRLVEEFICPTCPPVMAYYIGSRFSEPYWPVASLSLDLSHFSLARATVGCTVVVGLEKYQGLTNGILE